MEKKKVQVSVDKKREQQIEKEEKKGRGEREGIPSFLLGKRISTYCNTWW